MNAALSLSLSLSLSIYLSIYLSLSLSFFSLCNNVLIDYGKGRRAKERAQKESRARGNTIGRLLATNFLSRGACYDGLTDNNRYYWRFTRRLKTSSRIPSRSALYEWRKKERERKSTNSTLLLYPSVCRRWRGAGDVRNDVESRFFMPKKCSGFFRYTRMLRVVVP